MSLSITNAVRINPAPCQYFRLTVDRDHAALHGHWV
jgi:hypothetical protein